MTARNPNHAHATLLVTVLLAAACLHAVAQTPPAFTDARHVYERGRSCTLHVSAPGASTVEFDIDGWLPHSAQAGDGVAEYALDTNLLRAGDYTVRARIVKDAAVVGTAVFPLTIAKQRDDERMSVWRWGGGSSNPQWWQPRGFTGAFLASSRDPLDPASDTALSYGRLLERAAVHDFELGLYMHPLLSKHLAEDASVLSILPDGTPHEGKPYPLEPKVIEYAKQVTESWTAHFRDYPGLRHVMLHSEWQTPFSINEAAAEAARKEVGLEIKEWVQDKWRAVPAGKNDVRNGIIEDDNPRYRFLQWWWQRGHGTAVLNEALGAIVKHNNPDLITWHEPYRLAPVRDSHKGLDCIGTWTYGYPDIKRLCYATYLQAAARPEQQLVQQDITLFVYGRFAVPLGDSTADFGQDFAGKDPYFTAGPDYAREALWLVFSQRPDIICFYSAGALSPDKPTNDPAYASPDTFNAIGQTCEELVKPYGPAMLNSRRVAPRVAVLMSAAATWFKASPRLAGYPNEQTLPYAALLMMNHVPFDVLLDEDVVEGALDRYDVLVMPKADTLTRSMHERILAFVEDGGSVVADASLRAAIPNAQVTDLDFTHQLRIDGRELAKGNAVTAEEDREIMEGYAEKLAPLLAEVPRPADATSARVLTNSIEGGQARYHFFINDERTYGPRFGRWKLRFELGAPQTAEVSVALDGRPALYDALLRKPIEYETRQDRAVFQIRMTAARGKLIAALPEAIGSVALEAPENCTPGQPVTLAIKVLGESGDVLPCVLPLRIDVIDALGRETEWGRYTAARDGVREFVFIPAINDAEGTWTLRATDLVAGQTAESELRVSRG